jgi:hypothetical protein
MGHQCVLCTNICKLLCAKSASPARPGGRKEKEECWLAGSERERGKERERKRQKERERERERKRERERERERKRAARLTRNVKTECENVNFKGILITFSHFVLPKHILICKSKLI